MRSERPLGQVGHAWVGGGGRRQTGTGSGAAGTPRQAWPPSLLLAGKSGGPSLPGCPRPPSGSPQRGRSPRPVTGPTRPPPCRAPSTQLVWALTPLEGGAGGVWARNLPWPPCWVFYQGTCALCSPRSPPGQPPASAPRSPNPSPPSCPPPVKLVVKKGVLRPGWGDPPVPASAATAGPWVEAPAAPASQVGAGAPGPVGSPSVPTWPRAPGAPGSLPFSVQRCRALAPSPLRCLPGVVCPLL